MNRIKKLFFLFIVSLCVFYSCSKEDDAPREAEQLELTISVPESGGVNLHADYSGPSTSGMATIGFLVSTVNPPTFENATNLTAQVSNDKFTAQIHSDLIYNEEYFVRA